ncbi:MAG: hypothetical protein KDJ82_02435 [Rhodobacteraceae bacterium]|jgi:hypothetical protein|nr:hypothetical protein [Paracoccaceae bacterium]
MAITRDSDLHHRRFGRNLGLGLVLVAFAVLVFGLTIVKVQSGHSMEAFDHQPRVSLTPATEPVNRPAAPVIAPGAPIAQEASQ